MPVPKGRDWRSLREKYGVPQNTVKASVGAKLDKFHKAKEKSTYDALNALSDVYEALVQWRLYLRNKKDKPSQDFCSQVTAWEDDVRERMKKLREYLAAEKDAKKLTLEMVFKSKRLRKAFRNQCAKEYSTENFDFALDYLNRADPDWLYDTYVDPNGKLYLNLPHPIASKLTAAKSTGLKLADFKAAYESVKALMTDDTLGRFRVSPECIQALGIKKGFLDKLFR